MAEPKEIVGRTPEEVVNKVKKGKPLGNNDDGVRPWSTPEPETGKMIDGSSGGKASGD